MPKRFIGIDCDESELRLAVAVAEKGEPVVERTLRLALGEGADPGEPWRQAFGSEPAYGDRAAAALPAARAFFRRLELPFRDADKIEAVLPNELRSRLPLAPGELAVDFLMPRGEVSGSVPSIAADAEEVRQFLQPFDEAGIPLYCLDISPFGYAAGLPDSCSDGLLVTAKGNELTVALVVGGAVVDYRLLPAGGADDRQRTDFILSQAQILERTAGFEGMALYPIGDAVDESLTRTLREAGREVLVPPLLVQDEAVPCDMLPAALLARRAARRDRQAGFNLRRGALARKSEWAAVKSRLTLAGCLLAAVLIATVTSLSLSYVGKARRAEALKEQIVDIYRETFPGKRVLEHQVALQMKNEYQALEKQARLLGVGNSGSALEALRELSEYSDPQIEYRLSAISYTTEELRLEGEASSFDAVNRLGSKLGTSSLFREVQIVDAKMSPDGSQVGFRINLPISSGGDQ